MKIGILIAATFATSLPLCAWAQEVCLNDDGYVVPCMPLAPNKISSHFDVGSLPTKVGVPATVYIISGGTAIGSGYFEIRANKVALCNTGDAEGTTPIRYCTLTLTAPGTYTFDAVPGGYNNFEPPYPYTITVTQ